MPAELKTEGGHTVQLRDQVLDLAIKNGLQVTRNEPLLPTPVAAEGAKAPTQQTSDQKRATGQVWLSNVAQDLYLLGTPRVSSAHAATDKQVQAGAPKKRLEDQVLTTTWGKYEPAIRRWEQVINVTAPSPTIGDGRDGNHRLNAEFAEWLMGIPNRLDGLDLTRTERLKMAGNGVCPQQAELALTILIERLNTNE
jgi:DNA (cytosine-5)-methyltransferase 1